MRKWQASASSRPPPSALPCSAAITGLALASVRRDDLTQLWRLQRPAELAHVGTGAEDAAPAYDHERREGGSAAVRASAAVSPARTPCESAFTGGIVDRCDGNRAVHAQR